MKFTKEQAIEALKAKIPVKDKELDLERTITESVDNCLAFVGEESEMELKDFVEKAWKSVKTSIGLVHNENSKVAQKLQEQINELQKQVKSNKKKKSNDDNDDDDDDKDTDDPKIKELMDKYDALEKKMKQREDEETVSEKRRQLIEKMGESIKDKDWIENYLKEISITADTDVDAKSKDYIEFYNKTHAGGGKITPKSAGGVEDENSDVKSIVAAAARYKKQLSGRGSSVEPKTETK